MNIIDSIILGHTKYKPEEFTGGSIQCSVSEYTKEMRTKLVLYFGYTKNRNPISKSFDIPSYDVVRFAEALLERSKSTLDKLKEGDIGVISYDVVRGGASDSDSYRDRDKGSGKGDRDRGDKDSGKDSFSSVDKPVSDAHTKDSKPYIPTPTEFLEVWNENAEAIGLNPIRTMSKSRHDKLKTRIANNPTFLDDLLECLEIGSRSDLIRQGKWFGVDWLLANDTNYNKVLEGNYDNK